MAVQGINNRRVQTQILQAGRKWPGAGGQAKHHRGPSPMVPEGVQDMNQSGVKNKKRWRYFT